MGPKVGKGTDEMGQKVKEQIQMGQKVQEYTEMGQKVKEQTEMGQKRNRLRWDKR